MGETNKKEDWEKKEGDGAIGTIGPAENSVTSFFLLSSA
jgi:hypothetical protein